MQKLRIITLLCTLFFLASHVIADGKYKYDYGMEQIKKGHPKAGIQFLSKAYDEGHEKAKEPMDKAIEDLIAQTKPEDWEERANIRLLACNDQSSEHYCKDGMKVLKGETPATIKKLEYAVKILTLSKSKGCIAAEEPLQIVKVKLEEEKVRQAKAQEERQRYLAKKRTEEQLQVKALDSQAKKINPSYHYSGIDADDLLIEILDGESSLDKAVGTVVKLSNYWEAIQVGEEFALIKSDYSDIIVFLRGKNNFIDEQQVKGLVVIDGKQTYTTTFGASKTVISATKLNL